MILCVSTSSPWVSIAVWSGSGELIFSGKQEANQRASEVLVELLEEAPKGAWTGLVADVGPGSFIGVRVGVTFAKVTAWAQGCRVAGVSAFDLIPDEGELKVIPERRGQVFVQRKDVAALAVVPVSQVDGAVGYGLTDSLATYPQARLLDISKLEWTEPALLLPAYHVGPSISQPKTPYRGLIQ